MRPAAPAVYPPRSGGLRTAEPDKTPNRFRTGRRSPIVGARGLGPEGWRETDSMTLTLVPAAPTRLRFGILGPLAATLDGVDLNLGGRRQRGVVAALLLARGHLVSSERLLEALWQGAPPPSGPANLQAYVSHLRRALEPGRAARAASTVLVSRGSGYALPVADEDVDAWRFESLVQSARTTSDPRERVELLRTALALWRGPALVGYADQDWAAPEARRLDELRTVAREALLAARLDAGEAAVVVPELEALLVEEPLREERWRLLALALYRSHRQADALATLRRARTLLAEELGVDPGPALRRLEAELLAQSPALDVPPPRAAAAPALVDREAELARLTGCLEDALAGRPAAALIEGPAGIGKTSLLAELRTRAVAAGATVLSARGSQLEKEFGFGAVRQLFDPVLADPDTRAGLLAGAAAGAGRVFAPERDGAESLFATLHGLYWLTANLVERGPLVLAVDDVQWCDAGSLRFLGYLLRRLGGMRLLVVVTLRTGETYVDEDLLADLALDPDLLAVRPGPLSPAGVGELVRGRLPRADEAFVVACHRTTAGNPLLLRQLLRALEAEGVHPDASHADTVRAIGSRAVSSLVLRRFHRMPQAQRDVARAIAVLGDGASLPVVAVMTGLGEEETAPAIAALARSEVLRADLPLGFVHPLVCDAVYQDLPPGERELQHERAAQVLAATGATPEQVAAHLLLVPARGDAGVVEVLHEAARRDAGRGSGESAAAYLKRGLLEPPTRSRAPQLLMELGRLEEMRDGPAAMEHLAEAYELLDDPVARAETATMWARTAVFAGGAGDATRIARAAVDELGAGPDARLDDQRQALVALARIGAYMHGLDVDPATLGVGPEVLGAGPGARALAAAYAWELLCRGDDRRRAVELARFALDGRVLQRSDPGLLWVVAADVLELAGEDTTAFWDDELAHAYRDGGLFAVLAVHLWQGFAQWRRGDLRDALQSMVHCTEQNALWGANHVGQPYTDAFMVGMLLERGDVASAREALELARDRPRMGEGVRLYGEAEAAVLLAEGNAAAALCALEAVQHTMSAVSNPVWRPWRSARAQVLAALGRTDEAVDLLEEELAGARRWGEPGHVGSVLRRLGSLRADAATLREAVGLLADGTRRLELARAETDLAQVLHERVPGDPGHPDAVETAALLRDAFLLAETCAADGLRDEVATLMHLAGVDVPADRDRPVRLTAAERRIATMAAEGVPQSEIAQALFVTSSTVQTLVESVSRRLGARSLDELREALNRVGAGAAGDGPSRNQVGSK